MQRWVSSAEPRYAAVLPVCCEAHPVCAGELAWRDAVAADHLASAGLTRGRRDVEYLTFGTVVHKVAGRAVVEAREVLGTVAGVGHLGARRAVLRAGRLAAIALARGARHPHALRRTQREGTT